MKKVAKLAMIDDKDNYLLMYRGDHPTFGIDPDLPGGTLEDGESNLETILRFPKFSARAQGLPLGYAATDASRSTGVVDVA